MPSLPTVVLTVSVSIEFFAQLLNSVKLLTLSAPLLNALATTCWQVAASAGPCNSSTFRCAGISRLLRLYDDSFFKTACGGEAPQTPALIRKTYLIKQPEHNEAANVACLPQDLVAEIYPSSTGRKLLQYRSDCEYYGNCSYYTGGRIAGIIVGCVCFALAIFFAMLACTIRRRRMARFQVLRPFLECRTSSMPLSCSLLVSSLRFCHCRQTMLTQLAHTLRHQGTIRLTLRPTSIHRPIRAILRPHTPIRHIHRTPRATTQLHTILVLLTPTQLRECLQMESRCLHCLTKSQVTRPMCKGRHSLVNRLQSLQQKLD